MSWAAEVIFGVADVIGAFAAGMIIAMSPKGKFIETRFAPLSYLLLTPVFFANIGIKATIPNLNEYFIIFTLVLVIVAIASKILGCGLGAKLSGFTTKQSLQTGVGMVCRGEVALIVASKGMALNLIPRDFFGPIVIMIISCTIITPVLLKLVFKGDDKADKLEASPLVDSYDLPVCLDIVSDELIKADKEQQKLSKVAEPTDEDESFDEEIK